MKNTITINANENYMVDCIDSIYDGSNTLYLHFLTAVNLSVTFTGHESQTVTPQSDTVEIPLSWFSTSDLTFTVGGVTFTIKHPSTTAGNMTITMVNETTYQINFYQVGGGEKSYGLNLNGNTLSLVEGSTQESVELPDTTAEITPMLTSGTKIADYNMDGNTGELFAPDSSKVHVNDTTSGNTGDLLVKFAFNSVGLPGVISCGDGLQIDSISDPNNKNEYNINAHYIDDYSPEVLFVRFDDLTIGKSYVIDFKMSISGTMYDWGDFGYAVVCTSTYHSGTDIRGTDIGGNIYDLSDGFAIGLYYDNDMHEYTHSFEALGTTLYVCIDVSYLRNTFAEIYRDIVIQSLSLKANEGIDKARLKKVYANNDWIDIDYIEDIEPVLTDGVEIAKVHYSDETEKSIYAPTGGGGSSNYSATLIYDGSSDTRVNSLYSLTDSWDNYDAIYVIGCEYWNNRLYEHGLLTLKQSLQFALQTTNDPSIASNGGWIELTRTDNVYCFAQVAAYNAFTNAYASGIHHIRAIYGIKF